MRAALHENPHFPSYNVGPIFDSDFATLPHDHRLALMRNPCLAGLGINEVVLLVFDASDDTFDLTLMQRSELALAFLSNTAAIERSGDDLDSIELREPSDAVFFEKGRKRLWDLLTTFPDVEVRWWGFRCFGGKDEWKAAAYSATQESNNISQFEKELLKCAILSNTTGQDVQTLELGINDEDEQCRGIASKNYVDRTKPSRFRRVAGYIRIGFMDFIVLVIVLLLFSRVETTFEGLVVALLVYVHLDVIGSYASLSSMLQAVATGLDSEFRRLRPFKGEHLNNEPRQADAQQLEDLDQLLSKDHVVSVIHDVFRVLMWIVVVINLLSILF